MATRGMAEFRVDGVDYTINDPNNAPEFDASVKNEKDEYIYYQGDLYRFDAPHSANTAWSNRSKTKVKLGEELKNKVPNTRKVNGHALTDDININKSDVGLGNVDNTSDMNKPVSEAQQAAIDAAVAAEAAARDAAVDQLGDALVTEAAARAAADQSLEDRKVPKTTTVNGHALSGNVTVTKSDVGLGNVDNTSDVNKPVSTAQQAAIDELKSAFVSDVYGITGNIPIIYQNGIFYQRSTSQPVVNLTPTTYEGRAAAFFTCSAGDTFVVTGEGGGNAFRAWIFCDGSGNILLESGLNAVLNKTVITAPTGVVYAIFNTKTTNEYYAVKGEKALVDTVNANKYDFDNYAMNYLVDLNFDASNLNLTLGKYRNITTNTLTNDSSCAIIAYGIQYGKEVSFTDDDYLLSVIAYSDSSMGSANLIHGFDWTKAGEVIHLPANTAAYIFQFKKADGTTIASSEETAIKSAIKVYNTTDTTLTKENKAADAKTTGDKFDMLQINMDTANEAISEGKQLLPTIFVRGSRTNANSGEYLDQSVEYRITTLNKIKVDGDVNYTIADGFRCRRYWFQNGSFVSFDGSWKTNTMKLNKGYEYYVNIARVEEDETEIADINEFAKQVYIKGGEVSVLNVVVTGDSICRGSRNGGRGFIGDIGCPYVNIGIGGASLSNVIDSSLSTDTAHVMGASNIPDTIVKYATMTAEDWYLEPDAIISCGGVNDYNQSATLGTIPTIPVDNDTDAAALDPSTVMGGLQYLFYQMIKLFPKAHRFFLITHQSRTWPWTACSAGYTQTQLHDAIVAVCKLYGVTVIDVFGESFVTSTFSQYVSPTAYSTDHSVTNMYHIDHDKIHPLALGYRTGYEPFVKEALRKAVNL